MTPPLPDKKRARSGQEAGKKRAKSAQKLTGIYTL
jgi:hypothetical protein